MKRIRLLAMASVFLAATVAVWAQAQGATKTSPATAPNFSLMLVAPPGQTRVGEPVQVTVTVKNISAKEMPWRAEFSDTAYQAFHVLLTENGQELDKTPFHRKLRGEQRPGDPVEVEGGGSIVSDVAPGKSFSLTIDLARLYQIKGPGQYTLRVSRFDESNGTTVFSNAVAVSIAP